MLTRPLPFGVGAMHAQADEGWGKRPLPDLPGDPDFAWHLARSLVEQEFLIRTICQEMALDHGVLSFLPLLTDTDWKVPVVPQAVNVIQHPIPTPRRLYRLGAALGKAIASYPKDRRIVVFGTGGLTHQLHGTKFGTKNAAWANEFMDRLETEPAGLSETFNAGLHGTRRHRRRIEMIMWLGDARRAA